MILKFFAAVLSLMLAPGLYSQVVIVEVGRLRNTNGVVRLAVFSGQDQFVSDKPCAEYSFEKKTTEAGGFTVTIGPFSAGRYGIALLDDENSNGRIDYKLLFPCEGVGFSNCRPSGLRRPHFDDFSFYIGNGDTLRVVMDVRYY